MAKTKEQEEQEAKAKDKHAPYATAEQGKANPAAMAADLETAQFRHTREGGPFSEARVDPTETPEALAARRGKQTPRDRAMKGLAKYRCTTDCYREGVYIPLGSIIAVPEDEPASVTWEEVDDTTPVNFPFPKREETEEQRAYREKRKEAQELALQRQAELLAKNPQVLAMAIAAKAAADNTKK